MHFADNLTITMPELSAVAVPLSHYAFSRDTLLTVIILLYRDFKVSLPVLLLPARSPPETETASPWTSRGSCLNWFQGRKICVGV